MSTSKKEAKDALKKYVANLGKRINEDMNDILGEAKGYAPIFFSSGDYSLSIEGLVAYLEHIITKVAMAATPGMSEIPRKLLSGKLKEYTAVLILIDVLLELDKVDIPAIDKSDEATVLAMIDKAINIHTTIAKMHERFKVLFSLEGREAAESEDASTPENGDLMVGDFEEAPYCQVICSEKGINIMINDDPEVPLKKALATAYDALLDKAKDTGEIEAETYSASLNLLDNLMKRGVTED